MRNGIIGFAIGFLVGCIVTRICSDKKEQNKEKSGTSVPPTPIKEEKPLTPLLEEPSIEEEGEDDEPSFIQYIDEEDKAFQDLREDNPVSDRRWAKNRNVCLINEDELDDSGYETRHITYYDDGIFADSDNDEVEIHLKDAEEWFAISNFIELIQSAPVYTELFIRNLDTERDYVIEKEGIPYSYILEEKAYLKSSWGDE